MQLKMRKADLAAYSPVFADMLAVGGDSSGGQAEVPLTEPSAVLVRVLPFCYPGRGIELTTESPLLLSIARAFHKYDVSPAAGYILRRTALLTTDAGPSGVLRQIGRGLDAVGALLE